VLSVACLAVCRAGVAVPAGRICQWPAGAACRKPVLMADDRLKYFSAGLFFQSFWGYSSLPSLKFLTALSVPPNTCRSPIANI